MKKIIITASLLLAFVSCSTTQKSENHAMKTTGSSLIGGSFSMEDHNGKAVTEKDYLGQYTLVFFGFTSCPSVCPLGLSTMGRVLHRLPKSLSTQIQPLFVTVDPERDTNKVNKKFVKAFGRNFIGLRGTLDNTKDMVKKYRGYYKKTYEDGEKDYLMDHSDVIYLMDKEGKYLAHFGSSTGIESIVDRIKHVIK
jgi:protein SCO1/2